MTALKAFRKGPNALKVEREGYVCVWGGGGHGTRCIFQDPKRVSCRIKRERSGRRAPSYSDSVSYGERNVGNDVGGSVDRLTSHKRASTILPTKKRPRLLLHLSLSHWIDLRRPDSSEEVRPAIRSSVKTIRVLGAKNSDLNLKIWTSISTLEMPYADGILSNIHQSRRRDRLNK